MRVFFLFPEVFVISFALPGKESVGFFPDASMAITTLNERSNF